MNLISSALLLKVKYFIVSTVVPVSRSFLLSLKFSQCDFQKIKLCFLIWGFMSLADTAFKQKVWSFAAFFAFVSASSFPKMSQCPGDQQKLILFLFCVARKINLCISLMISLGGFNF